MLRLSVLSDINSSFEPDIMSNNAQRIITMNSMIVGIEHIAKYKLSRAISLGLNGSFSQDSYIVDIECT